MRRSNHVTTGRVSLASLVRGAAIVALVAAASGLVQAQSVSVTPNQTVPAGGWTVTPMFVFSQSTDNNVTLAGQGTPTSADDVAAFSPSIDAGYLGRLTSFNAGYAGSANRYFSLNQLDTYDQRLYANLKQQIAPHVSLFAHNSAGWMPTTDTLQFAGIPFVRVGSRIESLDAGATLAVARHSEVTAGYRFEWVDFDRSNPLASKLFGGHSNGVYGSFRQQVSPELYVGGASDYRHAIVAGGAQVFDILNAEGNLEYHFSPVFVVSGGAGLARISGSLPDQASRTGPAWHAGANYKYDRTQFFATYQRSWVPSFGIGGTIQNQELDFGAQAPIAFRNRLFAGASFSWRRNDPIVLTQTRITSRWLNLFGGYSLAPWLRVEGFYSHSAQDSHLGGVLRDQLGVRVVTLAPVRFK